MNNKVIAWDLADNLIDRLAEYILANFKTADCDFSRVACVFGGKRPALFLRRAISQRIEKPFYPPAIFTIEQFIEYILGKELETKPISDLEAAHSIYKIVRKCSPDLLRAREGFVEFLPWAREIHSFIEQLDLEAIADSRLVDIEKSAEIGYDVPLSINSLLKQIVEIRKLYHRDLAEKGLHSRGRLYSAAAKKVGENNFDEFTAIIFSNFFYLNRSELRIMKGLEPSGKGIWVFQGSSRQWSVLDNNAKELNCLIEPENKTEACSDFKFYQAFDRQSQVTLAKSIFETIKDKGNTVIVLPQAKTLMPLLGELSSLLDKCNISMGYPLKYSTLYTLFSILAQAQESRKDSKFYVKDYLNLLRHPLVKNLKISADPIITRVIIHKLEELLQGSQACAIGGSLFLSLEEIEQETEIYSLSLKTLTGINIGVTPEECSRVLSEIHKIFFSTWLDIDSLTAFSDKFSQLLDFLIDRSMLDKFPLNLKVVDKLQDLVTELSGLSFKEEIFSANEIWEIFKQKLDYEKISFSGSPLKGTQILGIFETRSLSFDNVIILDLNEGILPRLKIQEPLIPREAMLSLGLNRLEKEEEIQHYQFSSLISSAKQVHFIYEKNPEKERSRFLEEIFWKIEQEKASLSAAAVSGVSFALSSDFEKTSIKKTPKLIDYLRNQTYSASRINTYLQCPLKFYYQYVLGLKEPEGLLDEPQASNIGIFIHQLLEETFKQFKGRKPVIDQPFRDYFFTKMDFKFKAELRPRMKSDFFLLERIIRNRLERFLDQEAKRPVERIICLEENCRGRLDFSDYSLDFKYTVDRIDQLDDQSIVIIDYKTGGSDLIPKKLKVIEGMDLKREVIKENIRSFQLPLYYYFTAKEFPGKNINAQLYNLRNLEQKNFISQSDYPQRDKLLKACLSALAAIFGELFDLNICFAAEPDDRRCSFCSFRGICR